MFKWLWFKIKYKTVKESKLKRLAVWPRFRPTYLPILTIRKGTIYYNTYDGITEKEAKDLNWFIDTKYVEKERQLQSKSCISLNI